MVGGAHSGVTAFPLDGALDRNLAPLSLDGLGVSGSWAGCRLVVCPP
jgi:hypothetical protein